MDLRAHGSRRAAFLPARLGAFRLITTTRFTARLWRVPGKGGWTFLTVPPRHAPSKSLAWGRMPVVATVEGHRWKTSVWREKSGRTVLPVSRPARGAKGEGDRVKVTLEFAP